MRIKNLAQALSQLKDIQKRYPSAVVSAGFVNDTVYKPSPPNRKKSIPIAVIARKLEEGWIEQRPAETLIAWDGVAIKLPKRIQIVPPRHFMLNTVRKNKKSWIKLFISTLCSINNFEKTLDIVGQRIDSDIRYNILHFETPDNAPLTIRIKGFNNPLIETGQMLNDVDHKYTINKAKYK